MGLVRKNYFLTGLTDNLSIITPTSVHGVLLEMKLTWKGLSVDPVGNQFTKTSIWCHLVDGLTTKFMYTRFPGLDDYIVIPPNGEYFFGHPYSSVFMDSSVALTGLSPSPGATTQGYAFFRAGFTFSYQMEMITPTPPYLIPHDLIAEFLYWEI